MSFAGEGDEISGVEYEEMLLCLCRMAGCPLNIKA